MHQSQGPQERAIAQLSLDPEVVLQTPELLAAIADPGQWAGDVELALARLPRAQRDAIRRAARAVHRAGRAAATPQGGQRPERDPGSAPAAPYVLAYGAKVYVRRAGRYRLVDRSVAAVELEREGIRVTCSTAEGGQRPMTWGEIYGAHGDRVDEVRYQLGADADSYRDGVLTLACGQIDPRCVPTYDPEVDEWIDVLAGTQADRLRDWLACCTTLTEPIAALYLRAEAGAGKSMLACGIQAIYGGAIADYDDVILGSYSGALLRQPVVWLDERAGEDHHGRGSAGFRSLTANSQIKLTEKYLAAGTLIGCPRLVVTSNDDDALRFGREDLARTDEEAIGIRILHLVGSAEASSYLEGRGGRSYTSEWVRMADGAPGRIARHALWLRDHWRVTRPGSRLLVEGEVGAWLRGQASRSGLSQEILIAVARYLLDHRHDHAIPRVAAVHQGAVIVYALELAEAWQRLSGDARQMTATKLGRALGRFAAPHRGERRGHLVSLEQLLAALDEVGVGDPERLKTIVG